jgi:predicted DsbA family dithiol-disulfide isomerase
MCTIAFKKVSLCLICIGCAAAGYAQNTDATMAKTPVAIVAGEPVYDDDLIPSVQGQILPLRRQEYESLSYRDFPLTMNHPQAQLAAEASRCAGEQGKFWEYHDQLYNSSNLERPALVDYARALKLDDTQFDSCLASGKYRAQVEQDLHEGMQVGVSGTPGFFINGVHLTGAQPLDTFIRVIEDELARKAKTP